MITIICTFNLVTIYSSKIKKIQFYKFDQYIILPIIVINPAITLLIITIKYVISM